MTGQIVSHYQIQEQLGAEEVVYKARDILLERMVTLKFLSRKVFSFPYCMRNYLQEIKKLSSLDHPNISTIYKVNYTENGQLFISMAHYNGVYLKEILAKGPLPVAKAVQTALQIARGLSGAHGLGIIHRNIKPEKIMITDDGRVKILDFGYAHTVDNDQEEKDVSCEEFAYSSPELWLKIDADRRTDIWSLGIILFEMLAGKHPFEEETGAVTCFSIMHTNPGFEEMHKRDIPNSLLTVVKKSLQKQHHNRYKKIEDMIFDLQQISLGLKARSHFSLSKGSSQINLKRYDKVLLGAILLKALIVLYVVQSYQKFIKPPAEPCIAVLPFENIGPNPRDEYIAAGMTQELIYQLSQVESLKVIPRSTVMHFSHPPQRISEIKRKLKVCFILEGSVLKIGTKTHIFVRLIDVEKETCIWSKDFLEEDGDIISIQHSIAQHISQTISIQLFANSSTENKFHVSTP